MDNTGIKILLGDITQENVDAIVNAANSSLMGGGGVDGAIHHAAGPGLLEACKQLNGCNTGEAKITPGFNLPAKYIIHTVGPVWQGGGTNEDEKLATCYQNSFQVALDNQVTSIAFPAISTGIYGYPKKQAATIALSAINHLLEENEMVREVRFVCFGQEDYDIYTSLYKKL